MENPEFDKRREKFLYTLDKLETSFHSHNWNKAEIKEAIRYVSEELVWSDQNNCGFFKYFPNSDFKFRNTLNHFSKYLLEGKSKDLQIQLIQSANILIHNLSVSEHKGNKNKAFLLASQFYSLLITNSFNFHDDEIVENYMSFLKGLAANLPHSLLLPFVIHTKFEFLSKSFYFFCNKDIMYKNAARAGILRIIKMNSTEVLGYLMNIRFIKETFKIIISSWSKFLLLVKRNEKFNREFYVTSISDDLCYISDITETSEVFYSEVLQIMLSECFPWIISMISEINKNNENFNAIGFIIYSIFEHVKCSYIVNVLALALFSSWISEKMLDYNKGIFLIEFDLVDDNQKVVNKTKTFIQNIVKKGQNTAAVLVLLNQVITNNLVLKRVLFDCALLQATDVKSQVLLRKVLKGECVYESDSLFSQILMKVITSDQTTFNIFLAARLLILCRMHPANLIETFRQSAEAKKRDLVAKAKKLADSEKQTDEILESFESEFKAVKNLKISQKVKFPYELLHPVEQSTFWKYRMPVNNKEAFKNCFNHLMIICLILDRVYGEKNFEYLDCRFFYREMVFECRNHVKVIVREGFLYLEGSGQKVEISGLNVLKENNPCVLSLSCLNEENNVDLEFVDQESCSKCKMLIEKIQKPGNDSAMNKLQLYLDCLNSK